MLFCFKYNFLLNVQSPWLLMTPEYNRSQVLIKLLPQTRDSHLHLGYINFSNRIKMELSNQCTHVNQVIKCFRVRKDIKWSGVIFTDQDSWSQPHMYYTWAATILWEQGYICIQSLVTVYHKWECYGVSILAGREWYKLNLQHDSYPW